MAQAAWLEYRTCSRSVPVAVTASSDVPRTARHPGMPDCIVLNHTQASPILETMLQDACVDISTLLTNGSKPTEVHPYITSVAVLHRHVYYVQLIVGCYALGVHPCAYLRSWAVIRSWSMAISSRAGTRDRRKTCEPPRQAAPEAVALLTHNGAAKV